MLGSLSSALSPVSMRILHVTPYYEEAWAYGGIPRIAGALARGLAARGHAVTVCTTDACDHRSRLPRATAGGAASPHRAPGEIDVRVFENLSNRAAYHLQLFAPLGLSSYLESTAHTFDVAHLHACHNLPGALAARWSTSFLSAFATAFRKPQNYSSICAFCRIPISSNPCGRGRVRMRRSPSTS